MTIIITYWILTTLYGVYWLIKHPSERNGDNTVYFTLMDIIAYIFPAAVFGWVFAPMILLNKIKFKR